MYVIISFLLFFSVRVHCRDTIGINLDNKFQSIQSNFTNLKNRYQQLENQLEHLKSSFHKSCFPCLATKIINDDEKQICDCRNLEPKQDCLEFYQHGVRKDGLYKLSFGKFKTLNVFCDQTTAGGGWTVFQRRVDASVDFYRNWNEYREGFGEVGKNLWLGNDNIHDLTKPSRNPKNSTLLINVKIKGNGTKLWAKYNSFYIEDELSKFLLHLSGFSGNMEDVMYINNNMKFTTYDQDNDNNVKNCANLINFNKNAFWNNNCSWVTINGIYEKMEWKWTTRNYVTFSEMKVRRNL